MKIKTIVLVIFLSINSFLFAQTLTVNETINYIQEQFQKYKLPVFKNGAGYKFSIEWVSIQISQEGFMSITQYITSYDFPNNSGPKKIVFDFHDVTSSIFENRVSIDCKNFENCMQELPSGKSSPLEDMGPLNKEGLLRIKNAFEYLLDILKYDKQYNQNDNDPFSKNNYKKNITVESKTNDDITLTYDGNISTLAVNIGGVVTTMVLDSGASDVTISKDVESDLIEKGIISKDSYLEPGLYKLADGSVVTSQRIKVPFLKVGSFEVKNVICSVSPTGNILLLGKSFLDQFSKWSIDNNKHILTLEK